MIPRTLSTGVAVSLLAATASLVPTATTANGQEAAAATTSPTRYAMAASGYGTRVRGGDIPASSDRTAYDAIGCTNRAGLDHNNFVADVDLGSLGSASTVTTRVWTTSRNGTVSSYARNRIADVRLGGKTPGSVVAIKGIESLSRAYHDASGFHAQTSTKLASITLDLDGTGPLPAVNVPRLPTQGNPIVVAGLQISVGSKTELRSASGAIAKRDALKITVILTKTQVVLAHSRAEIHAGVVSGLFRGNAYGANATALDKTLRLGKTPYVLMPCQGTNGKVIRNDTARVDRLSLSLILTGLTARERAAQSQSRADAYTEGRVAKAKLGHGVVVRAIVGRANVHYVRGQGITTNIKGSTFGSVTRFGAPLKFGSDNVIKIGTVLTLRRNIVQRTSTSIEVTALQVRVLGADVVSVNLGHAKVGVKKSGL